MQHLKPITMGGFRLSITGLVLLFSAWTSAQTYISSTSYPFELESFNGQTYQGDFESADFILPTSDGGYLLVGSVEFDGNPSDYDGRLVKIAADGTRLRSNFFGFGGLDYFYGAVELGGHYYIVGDFTSEGDSYPAVFKFRTSDLALVDHTGYAVVRGGKGLTIEVTYGDNLVIGGYAPDPNSQGTTGYYLTLAQDLRSSLNYHNGIGDKVEKIVRSADGNYYLFGTSYDPTQSCSDPQESSGNTLTSSITNGGSVLVTKIAPDLRQIWQREVGGDTHDIFIDGVATPDGGFALIGQTNCIANDSGEETGPSDVANQNGVLFPYWLFKGAGNGGRLWERSLFYANFFSYVTTPFGLINSCYEDQFLVANSNVGRGFFAYISSIDLYAVTRQDQDLLSITSDDVYTDIHGRDIAIGNDGSVVFSGFHEDGIEQDFVFSRFSPESGCGIPSSCSSCVDGDPFLPTPYQCDDFEAYTLGNLSSQATDWTRWPNSTGDGLIEVVAGGNQVLAIRGGAGDSDMLFNLNGPTGPNVTTGRHRLSWEMFVEPGAEAYYNVQYDKNSLGVSGNWAFRAYFNSDGTGRIARLGQADIPFTYPQGQTFRIAHIIDLEEDVLEFWLDHEHQFSASYSAAVAGGITVGIGVINFFAETNGPDDFWVDQLCIRTTGLTGSCGDAGLASLNLDQSVCTEHGIRYDDACDAGNNGLYHRFEYGDCLSICDYNAVVIGRDDQQGYEAALSTANEIPTLLYGEPCVQDRYDNQVPYPLYGDIYVLDNDQTQPISLPQDVSGVEFFVFRCLVGGGQTCVTNPDADQAPGTYYIVAVGPNPVTYNFVVTPSSICELSDQNPRLSCTNNSIITDFTSGATDVLDTGGAYQSCYGGGRSYEGEERVFQLLITEPSLVDISLNTNAGAGGLFVLGANCGSDCVNYIEAPDGGGAVVLDSLALAPGNYYLVVDQESPIGSFSLDISCTVDDVNAGFGGFFVTTFDNPACELSVEEDEDHQVAVEIADVASFVDGQTLFQFNRISDSGLPILNNDSLSQVYNGSELLVFNLPLDLTTDPSSRCSFVNGDSLQLTIIRFLGQAATGFTQRMEFAEPGPGVTASGRFASGQRSVVESFENTASTIFIQVPTEVLLLQNGEPKDEYWLVSDPWVAHTSQEWLGLHVVTNAGTPSEGLEVRGNGNGTVEVLATSPNNTYRLRRGFITVESEDGAVSQRIQVEQLGLCEMPQISSSLPETIQLCAGESVSLEVEAGPGAREAYSYRWSNGESGSPNITVTPTSSQTYTVTVTQPMGGRCNRSSTLSFQVLVDPPVAAPVSNGDQTICADQSAILRVSVNPGETANWYATPDTLQPSLSNSTTYTTSTPGVYYAEAVRTGSGCTSDTRTAVRLSVDPLLELTPNDPQPNVCPGQSVLLSVSATGGGTGSTTYTWRRDGQVLPAAGSSYDFAAVDPGPQLISVEVNRGACTAIQNFVVEVGAPAELVLVQPGEADCAADLQTYAASFTTNGLVTPPATGQLSTTNGSDYVLSGIPRGENVVLEIVSADGCSRSETIRSPTCACPTDIPAPIINDGVASLAFCIDEGPPLLTASVADPAVQTVNWYDGDGMSAAMATLEFEPPGAGTYFAETVDQRNDCRGEEVAQIILESITAISLSTSSTTVAACVGDELILTASANGGQGTLNYEWTADSGVLGTMPTLNWTASEVGITTLRLNVLDAGGYCSATEDFTITIAPNPVISSVRADCASNLLSYQVTLTTNGQTISTDNPQAAVSPEGGGVFLVSNIPIGEDIMIRAELGDCAAAVNVSAPNCECESHITLPLINNGSGSIQICAGGAFPPLTATVDDPATYTVDWYGEDDQLLRADTYTYQPTAAGTYYAETRNRENNCTSTTRSSFILESIPQIELVATTTEVTRCQGEELTLRAAAVGGVAPLTYTWFRDGEEVGSGFELPGTAAEVGTYQVLLQITDAAGVCGLQVEFTVTVLPQPAISRASNLRCSDDLMTYGFEVTATGAHLSTDVPEAVITSIGDDRYLLSLIPVDRAITIFTTNPDAARICEASLVVEPPIDCSCSSLSLPLPDPQNETLSVCAGEEIPAFTLAPLAEGLIPLWYLSSAAEAVVVQEGGLSYRATQAGNVYVRVQDEASSCVSDNFLTLTLTVHQLPQVTAGMDIVACVGSEVELLPTVQGGVMPLRFTWSGEGQFSATDIENPTYWPSSSTMLRLEVIDANDCIGTGTLAVSALALPTASLQIGDPILCAMDSTGELTVMPLTGQLPFQYVWNDGIGTTAQVGGLPAGTYTVSITDGNQCTNTLTQVLNAPSPLEFSILEQQDGTNDSGVLTPGTILVQAFGGVSPYNYEWRDEAGMVRSDSARIVVDADGFYDCLITDENGCTLRTPALEVVIFTDLGELSIIDDGLRIYPNPTQGRLRLEFLKAPRAPLRLQLLDMVGRRVEYYRFEELMGRSLELDLVSLPTGTYWLLVETADAVYRIGVTKI
jgi:hypothetical protein